MKMFDITFNSGIFYNFTIDADCKNRRRHVNTAV